MFCDYISRKDLSNIKTFIFAFFHSIEHDESFWLYFWRSKYFLELMYSKSLAILSVILLIQNTI